MSAPRLGELEQAGLWADFHSKFINYLQEALADRLPDNYEARIGEHLNLYEYAEPTKRFGPDVAVVRDVVATAFRDPISQVSLVESIEPVVVEHIAIAEEQRQSYLEIIHRPNRDLVSVLELRSPSNKEEPGRSRYLAKRLSLLN